MSFSRWSQLASVSTACTRSDSCKPGPGSSW
jgi:hypothetical protein